MLKALSLGIMIYGVYTATTKPSFITIAIIVLTSILWITQIILEIILSILEKQINRMVTSMKADIQGVKESFSKSKEKITNKINQFKEKKLEKKDEIGNHLTDDNLEIIIDEEDNTPVINK